MNYRTFGIISSLVMIALKCIDEYYKKKNNDDIDQR